MRNILGLITVLSLLSAHPSFAKNILLEPGENYSIDDVNVICVENKRTSFAPVSISDCQYWDDFNQICLHEKEILTTGDLECVEECQHWDDFNKKCLYETYCRFDRSNHLFIKTTCLEFDSFTGKCLKSKDHKVDPK